MPVKPISPGTVLPNVNQRGLFTNNFNMARSNLLAVVLFTAVNMLLFAVGSDSYFLFSASIPYQIFIFAMYFCGKMPAEYYDGWATPFFNDTVFAVLTVISVVFVLMYLFAWIFSKKHQTGWMIFALVFFVLDTAGMFYTIGISTDSIIDIIFHLWVLIYLVIGVVASVKLKKLPPEEPITVDAIPADGEYDFEDEEEEEEDTPELTEAEIAALGKMKIEVCKDGNVIRIYNAPSVCSLVINNRLVDKYCGLVGGNFTLRGNIIHDMGTTTVEAKMGAAFMSVYYNGTRVAKKIIL